MSVKFQEREIAKKTALKHLSRYDEMYSEKYQIIDPLIKPLCELLTKHGYITMHSCSSHVKTTSYILGKMFPDKVINNPEDAKKWKHQDYAQWYILFIETESMIVFKRIINSLNKKYNYKISCRKTNDYKDLTLRWIIETRIPKTYKNNDIYELNKNIYSEFKNFLEKES